MENSAMATMVNVTEDSMPPASKRPWCRPTAREERMIKLRGTIAHKFRGCP